MTDDKNSVADNLQALISQSVEINNTINSLKWRITEAEEDIDYAKDKIEELEKTVAGLNSKISKLRKIEGIQELLETNYEKRMQESKENIEQWKRSIKNEN